MKSCWICGNKFVGDPFAHELVCSDCLRNTSITQFDRIVRTRTGVADIKAVLAREELEKYLSIKELEQLRQSGAIDRHLPALRRNFARALVYDDFGGVEKDNRAQVVDKFLNALGGDFQFVSRSDVLDLIEEELKNERIRNASINQSIPENGIDFEYWVAEKLVSHGWKAWVTKGSGDQGIDVVAENEGICIGVQCKRYAGSVGNKAVQEAFSGAKHLGLDRAAVLTNSDFTKSARDLAASTGVLLLSPEDIPTLAERL